MNAFPLIQFVFWPAVIIAFLALLWFAPDGWRERRRARKNQKLLDAANRAAHEAWMRNRSRL